MKFPTSSSSHTVVSSNTIVASNSNPIESSASSLVVTSSHPGTTMTSTPSPNLPLEAAKKSEAAASESMATNFTSTAGNFFRRYTSTQQPASNSQEMTQLKLASEASSTIVNESLNNDHLRLNSSAQQPAKKISSSSSSAAATAEKATAKKSARSRKVTRAPQPPGGAAAASNKAKKAVSPNNAVLRPCQTHSFHTDAAEVEQMETVLLKLLDDFNSGKLRAFGMQ